MGELQIYQDILNSIFPLTVLRLPCEDTC